MTGIGESPKLSLLLGVIYARNCLAHLFIICGISSPSIPENPEFFTGENDTGSPVVNSAVRRDTSRGRLTMGYVGGVSSGEVKSRALATARSAEAECASGRG